MDAQPILFCSHTVDWGRAEMVLADLFAALDRSRFRPHLACPGPGPLASRALELDVAVHTVALGGNSPLRKIVSLPGAARGLRSLADQLGTRLLYANTMIAGYAGVLAQKRDLRCLWHMHIVTPSRWARLAAARSAAVVTPSRAGLAAVLPRAANQHRGEVVQNAVPAAFFTGDGSGLRGELGVAEHTLLVGSAGRIDPQKGLDVLLRAAAMVPAAHVVIAGGESFADALPRIRGHGEELRRLAASLGIADRVHFLGHRQDVPGLLAQFDLVVVPSTAPESAPRAVAEAQAAGRAVIASDVGGVAEMITDGETGRLCRAGDAATLAETMRALLGSEAERRRLGTAARNHALANYGMSVFARRIEAICELLLATTAAASA